MQSLVFLKEKNYTGGITIKKIYQNLRLIIRQIFWGGLKKEFFAQPAFLVSKNKKSLSLFSLNHCLQLSDNINWPVSNKFWGGLAFNQENLL